MPNPITSKSTTTISVAELRQAAQLAGQKASGALRTDSVTLEGKQETEPSDAVRHVTNLLVEAELLGYPIQISQTNGQIVLSLSLPELTEPTQGSFTLERQLHCHDDHIVSALAWSPDGKQLATKTGNVARIWDVETGTGCFEIPTTQAIQVIAWSFDGKHIVTGSKEGPAIVWNAETGGKLFSLKDGQPRVCVIAYSPDKTKFVTVGNGELLVRDANSGSAQYTLLEYSALSGMPVVAWSPDGKYLATNIQNEKGDTATIWDMNTRLPHYVIRDHKTWAIAIAWSPGGDLITSGGRTATVWNTETGGKKFVLGSHRGAITMIDCSPDGRYIITASRGFYSSATVWNAATGEPICTIQDPPRQQGPRIQSVAWSPANTRFAIGKTDGDTAIYRVNELDAIAS